MTAIDVKSNEVGLRMAFVGLNDACGSVVFKHLIVVGYQADVGGSIVYGHVAASGQSPFLCADESYVMCAACPVCQDGLYGLIAVTLVDDDGIASDIRGGGNRCIFLVHA